MRQILDVDETVIVRIINDMPYPTSIHWHVIETVNYSDSTNVCLS
ncbi:MAG: multicopper oxidase domain-containing protein [Saprospiraceae bacterium]